MLQYQASKLMKYDGGEASSEDDANRDSPVVRQAAFNRCSITSHTSPVRSGCRPQLKVMHLSPRCAIWLACTKGQSPAEASMIECRASLHARGCYVGFVADAQASQLADEVGIEENISHI